MEKSGGKVKMCSFKQRRKEEKIGEDSIHVSTPGKFKFELNNSFDKTNKRCFAEKTMNTRYYLQDYNRPAHSRCVEVPVQTLLPNSEWESDRAVNNKSS